MSKESVGSAACLHCKHPLTPLIMHRCGASAILLTNKWRPSLKAKYKLLNLVRTTNCTDEAYQSVFETQDHELQRGVRLSKNIINVAGRTMKTNLTALGCVHTYTN